MFARHVLAGLALATAVTATGCHHCRTCARPVPVAAAAPCCPAPGPAPCCPNGGPAVGLPPTGAAIVPAPPLGSQSFSVQPPILHSHPR